MIPHYFVHATLIPTTVCPWCLVFGGQDVSALQQTFTHDYLGFMPAEKRTQVTTDMAEAMQVGSGRNQGSSRSTSRGLIADTEQGSKNGVKQLCMNAEHSNVGTFQNQHGLQI